MKSTSFLYLTLGCFILLVSCKKDQLTLTPIDPIISASDCGDEFITLDVDFYYTTVTGIAHIPVCTCDTVEFSFSNVDPSWTFLEWGILDPVWGISPVFTPTLTLPNPDLNTVIFLNFDDGTSSSASLLIFLEEDTDC